MNIQFTKIAKYNLYPFSNSKDNFNFICQVLKQNIDPPSSNPQSINLGNELILSSQLKRARECIKPAPNSKIIYLPQLSEIKIDLRSLCDFKQWEKIGSSIVRQKFKEAFIADKLAISRLEIYQEAQEVFDLIDHNKSTTIVSHTFRLVLLKAILETQGQIIKNPQLINNYIFDDRKIFNFGESFYLNFN